ncbi:MAG: hypothetical protein ACOYL3_20655 [Desulfuromonadaceae bacterium]
MTFCYLTKFLLSQNLDFRFASSVFPKTPTGPSQQGYITVHNLAEVG